MSFTKDGGSYRVKHKMCFEKSLVLTISPQTGFHVGGKA